MSLIGSLTVLQQSFHNPTQTSGSSKAALSALWTAVAHEENSRYRLEGFRLHKGLFLKGARVYANLWPLLPKQVICLQRETGELSHLPARVFKAHGLLGLGLT